MELSAVNGGAAATLPRMARLALGVVVWLGFCRCASAGLPAPTAEQVRYFEREVRPILAEHCLKCHGKEKQKGGLRLDSRAALLAGGDNGPGIEPGKPQESLLIEAIHYEALEMPPNGKLPGPAIAASEQWVKIGAPWPDSAPQNPVAESNPTPATTGKSGGAEFSAEDRAWWAFQPVHEPAPPAVADGGWSRNPIDRFICASCRRRD